MNLTHLKSKQQAFSLFLLILFYCPFSALAHASEERLMKYGNPAENNKVRSNYATIKYTQSTNTSPLAVEDSYTTNEDVALDISASGVLANDTDSDGDSLTASVVSAPENGFLILNGDGSFSYTPDSDFNGSDSFTYKASDGTSDSNIATVTITVNPVNDAPVTSLPALPEKINELEPLSFIASATDADGDDFSFSLSGAPDGAVIDPISGQFSWTPAEHQDGNFDFKIQVNDSTTTVAEVVSLQVKEVNTAPVLDSVANAAITCDSLLSFTATAVDADIVNGAANTLSYTLEGVVPVGATIEALSGKFSWQPSSEQMGSHDITIRVTDNGLPASFDEQVFSVTMEDTVAPTVLARDKVVYLDEEGTATIAAGEVNNGSSDNCTSAADLLMSLDKSSFSCNEVGTHTVKLTVQDAAGNSAFSDVTVTVEDTLKPQIAVNPLNLQLDASGKATIIADDIDNGSSDNCSIQLLSIDKDSFSCENIGENTVTLTATDSSGNTASATAIVTITDATPPVARASDITLYLNEEAATLTAEDINNGSSDNCSIASISVDKTTFSCEALGGNSVQLTVTDQGGLQSTATAIVTLSDTIPPLIQAPAAVTISTDEGKCSAVVALGESTVNELCSYTLTNNAPEGNIFPTGTTMVTWTATDAAGNSATAQQKVIVEDKEAPTIETPADIALTADTGKCGAVVTFSLPAIADNCSGAEITQTDETGLASGALFPVGTTLLSYTVTDAAGNSDSSSFRVIVRDEEAPVVLTHDLVIGLDAEGNASISAADIDNGSTDNCAIASMAIDKTYFSCTDLGENSVVLTVTDKNGNISTGSAMITVTDIIAPVIEGGQVFHVDEKSTTGTIIGQVLADDNCQLNDFSIIAGNTAEVFSIDQAGVITASGAAALDYETIPEYTLTVKATDGSDNFASRQISIMLNNVNDKAPVVAFLPDIAGNEHEQISFTARATAEDEAAGELQFSLAEGAPDGASIDAASGKFSWTPSEIHGPAAHNITVIVSDGTLTDAEELVIWVEEINEAPRITSEPVMLAREGEGYTYQLTATDADLPANTLTYKALKVPSWLSFDPATQVLSGTPAKDVEESNLVSLQLSDGKETVTQEFLITVERLTALFKLPKQMEEVMVFAYPNPTEGSIRLKVDEGTASQIIGICLRSLEGKLLFSESGNLKSVEKSLNHYLPGVNGGTYLLQLKTKDKVMTIKVIKI